MTPMMPAAAACWKSGFALLWDMSITTLSGSGIASLPASLQFPKLACGVDSLRFESGKDRIEIERDADVSPHDLLLDEISPVGKREGEGYFHSATFNRNGQLHLTDANVTFCVCHHSASHHSVLH